MTTNLTIADYQVINATLVDETAFTPIGYGLEVLLPKGAKTGDTWTIIVEQFKTPEPLAHTMLGKNLFVSSSKEQLSVISNNIVVTPNPSKGAFNYETRSSVPVPDYRTGMLATFFNHIFLAKGRTLHWTDLDNIWEWQPLPENEADFRELEWESHDISGLARVNDQLYIHFPNGIYEVKYVGKPTVVNIQSRVHGIGAVSPRTLIVHNSIQFFIGTDNIYIWSPETGVNPIGNDIWKKFLTTRAPIDQTWAYVDQRNNEVCWVSGDFVWAFNYIERHWSKYSSNSIRSHATIPWTTPQITITAATENLSGLMSTIDKVNPDGMENLWVVSGAVVREQRWGDLVESCLPFEAPYLETDDITYEDMHFHKKVDLVTLDAKYEFPWEGVRVLVSGRDYVTHPSNWIDCGVWTKQAVGKQLDFRAVQGKVLKYRFVLQDQLVTQVGVPNGGLKIGPDGRVMDAGDIWDGTIKFDAGHLAWDGTGKLDGERVAWGRQFVRMNGTRTLADMHAPYRLNYFELNAWGERVDLPQTLVGPDK